MAFSQEPLLFKSITPVAQPYIPVSSPDPGIVATQSLLFKSSTPIAAPAPAIVAPITMAPITTEAAQAPTVPTVQTTTITTPLTTPSSGSGIISSAAISPQPEIAQAPAAIAPVIAVSPVFTSSYSSQSIPTNTSSDGYAPDADEPYTAYQDYYPDDEYTAPLPVQTSSISSLEQALQQRWIGGAQPLPIAPAPKISTGTMLLIGIAALLLLRK